MWTLKFIDDRWQNAGSSQSYIIKLGIIWLCGFHSWIIYFVNWMEYINCFINNHKKNSILFMLVRYASKSLTIMSWHPYYYCFQYKLNCYLFHISLIFPSYFFNLLIYDNDFDLENYTYTPANSKYIVLTVAASDRSMWQKLVTATSDSSNSQRQVTAASDSSKCQEQVL